MLKQLVLLNVAEQGLCLEVYLSVTTGSLVSQQLSADCMSVLLKTSVLLCHFYQLCTFCCQPFSLKVLMQSVPTLLTTCLCLRHFSNVNSRGDNVVKWATQGTSLANWLPAPLEAVCAKISVLDFWRFFFKDWFGFVQWVREQTWPRRWGRCWSRRSPDCLGRTTLRASTRAIWANTPTPSHTDWLVRNTHACTRARHLSSSV